MRPLLVCYILCSPDWYLIWQHLTYSVPFPDSTVRYCLVPACTVFDSDGCRTRFSGSPRIKSAIIFRSVYSAVSDVFVSHENAMHVHIKIIWLLWKTVFVKCGGNLLGFVIFQTGSRTEDEQLYGTTISPLLTNVSQKVFRKNSSEFEHCGVNDCQDPDVIMESADKYEPSSQTALYVLIGCLTGFALLSAVIIVFATNNPEKSDHSIDYRLENHGKWFISSLSFCKVLLSCEHRNKWKEFFRRSLIVRMSKKVETTQRIDLKTSVLSEQ